MQRRTCLRLLGITPFALASAPAWAQESDWEAWKAAFLAPDGRVVDALQGGISHSEGQGYGMVLATAFGDQAAFRAMRDWTEAHLAVRRDPLLAWRWHPDEAAEARDYNNASDGDLFYAWALLRGARRFGEDATRAGEVARALSGICVIDDPRGDGRLLLLPGAERFRTDLGCVVNLSYVMPLALHELAAAFDQPRLAACAEDGAKLMWEAAGKGPVPDWILVTADGWRPSPFHRPVSSYEALRLPLWLVWSGRPGHPAVSRAVRGEEQGPTTVMTDLATGAALERSDAPGYAAVFALAACAISVPGSGGSDYSDAQPYYPATLHLLAAIAAREAGGACGDH